MSVRWPDGSITGSVRVEDTAPTPVKTEPETQIKKETAHGDR